MVTLNSLLSRFPSAATGVLNSVRDAREKELPMYEQRFRDRVPDPGAMLRHSKLSDVTFWVTGRSSAFFNAWSALRELGKSGVYSDEDVDKQIGIMQSELIAIEAEVVRWVQSRDSAC